MCYLVYGNRKHKRVLAKALEQQYNASEAKRERILEEYTIKSAQDLAKSAQELARLRESNNRAEATRQHTALHIHANLEYQSGEYRRMHEQLQEERFQSRNEIARLQAIIQSTGQSTSQTASQTAPLNRSSSSSSYATMYAQSDILRGTQHDMHVELELTRQVVRLAGTQGQSGSGRVSGSFARLIDRLFSVGTQNTEREGTNRELHFVEPLELDEASSTHTGCGEIDRFAELDSSSEDEKISCSAQAAKTIKSNHTSDDEDDSSRKDFTKSQAGLTPGSTYLEPAKSGESKSKDTAKHGLRNRGKVFSLQQMSVPAINSQQLVVTLLGLLAGLAVLYYIPAFIHLLSTFDFEIPQWSKRETKTEVLPEVGNELETTRGRFKIVSPLINTILIGSSLVLGGLKTITLLKKRFRPKPKSTMEVVEENVIYFLQILNLLAQPIFFAYYGITLGKGKSSGTVINKPGITPKSSQVTNVFTGAGRLIR